MQRALTSMLTDYYGVCRIATHRRRLLPGFVFVWLERTCAVLWTRHLRSSGPLTPMREPALYDIRRV